MRESEIRRVIRHILSEKDGPSGTPPQAQTKVADPLKAKIRAAFDKTSGMEVLPVGYSGLAGLGLGSGNPAENLKVFESNVDDYLAKLSGRNTALDRNDWTKFAAILMDSESRDYAFYSNVASSVPASVVAPSAQTFSTIFDKIVVWALTDTPVTEPLGPDAYQKLRSALEKKLDALLAT